MSALQDKIENSLNEGRLLVLAAQVIFGFDLQLAFKSAFTALPRGLQVLQLFSVFMMIFALALLLLPGAFHRIVEPGKATQQLLSLAHRMIEIALFAFSIAAGIGVLLAAWKILSPRVAVILGVAVWLGCVGFWYLHPRSSADDLMKATQEQEQIMDLKDRVKEVLIETRTVLPGAQAMLGFQFISIFSDGFPHLPKDLQMVHLAALLLVTVSVTMLVAPAAYHRIAKKGEDSEDLVRYASRCIIAALAFLGLGISVEALPLTYIVTNSYRAGLIAGAICLVGLYSAWFGYTSLKKRSPVSAGQTAW